MAKIKNYLLFMPSLLKNNASEITYKVVLEEVDNSVPKVYIGTQTNEAVTKFLLEYLNKRGQRLEKIIMLCTPETRQNLYSVIGRNEKVTSLEYYQEQILRYAEEHEIEYNPNTLFEVIFYEPQDNATETNIMQSLEIFMKQEEQEEIKKHLYVDFSGGHRNAALIEVFCCRILEKMGVEIDKILYSSLYVSSTGIAEGMIEDCTHIYKIFSIFETEMMVKHNISLTDKEKSVLGAEIVEQHRETQKFTNMNQYEKAEQAGKKLEELAKSNFGKGSYAEQMLMQTVTASAKKSQKAEKDVIYKIKQALKAEQYKDAFSIFREKIFPTIYEKGIIKVNDYHKKYMGKSTVADEVAAVYNYYCGENKYTHSFLGAVKEYVKVLRTDFEQSPIEVWEKEFGEAFYSLEKYLDKVPIYGFKHTKNFSRVDCDKVVLTYMQDFSGNIIETMNRYCDLDSLYMGYGFPFVCTYGGKEYYRGYDKLYRKNLECGIESLQNLFEGRIDWRMQKVLDNCSGLEMSYAGIVQKLDSDEILAILFPFELVSRNICSEVLKKDEWDKFIWQLAGSYCIVKDVRNKITHPREIPNGKGEQAVEEMKHVLQMIEEVEKCNSCI